MAVKKRKVSKETYQDAKAYYTHGGAAYDIEPMEEEYAPPKKQIKKQKKIKKRKEENTKKNQPLEISYFEF